MSRIRGPNGLALTSKLVQVHDACHISSHDVSWEPVISLQKPGIVLLDKLSVLCIGPESVLPPGMHFPVAQVLPVSHRPRFCAVTGRIGAGWSLKLILSVINRLLSQR